MDEHGEISEAAVADESRSTAERHTSNRRLRITHILWESGLTATPASPDPAVDEVTDMFAGLNKKKKKPSKPKTEDGADETEPTPAVDGEFDASALKKKKKKSSKPKTAETADSFDAKLAEKGIEDPDADQDTTAAAVTNGAEPEGGDFETGTGIWAHSSAAPISYTQLLSRFYTMLNHNQPRYSILRLEIIQGATTAVSARRKQEDYFRQYRRDLQAHEAE